MKKWATETELGAMFETSRKQVAEVLEKNGLKAFDPARGKIFATPEAVEAGYALQTQTGEYAIWNVKKVIDLIPELRRKFGMKSVGEDFGGFDRLQSELREYLAPSNPEHWINLIGVISPLDETVKHSLDRDLKKTLERKNG